MAQRLIAFGAGVAIVYMLGFITGSLFFNDLLNNPSKLSPYKETLNPEKYKLAILIFSSPSNFETRQSIRNTWLSTRFPDVIYYFAIGLTETKLSNKLLDERSAHSDLLFLNITDSYHSLTQKLLHSLRWLSLNVKSDYVLKCDDDSYVKVDAIRNELYNYNSKSLYWGFFDGRAHVKKAGNWGEGNWFLCDRYLPYALGGGYVISKDIVDYISKNSEQLSVYENEDVSMGVWTAPLKIKRMHDQRFNTEFMSRGCSNKYIINHKMTPSEMNNMHKSLLSSGILCEVEYQSRPSYTYNWKVPPTKCCVRNESAII